jgi:hypothetical protein
MVRSTYSVYNNINKVECTHENNYFSSFGQCDCCVALFSGYNFHYQWQYYIHTAAALPRCDPGLVRSGTDYGRESCTIIILHVNKRGKSHYPRPTLSPVNRNPDRRYPRNENPGLYCIGGNKNPGLFFFRDFRNFFNYSRYSVTCLHYAAHSQSVVYV